jgi:hypothetical protein
MILVDELKLYTGKRIKYAHMVSTKSIEELHEFAAKIGIKRHFLSALTHYC